MLRTNAAADSPTHGQPPLASVPELAFEYGLPPWFVYELIRKNKLPAGVVVRLGPRTTRISRAKWAAFIEDGGLATGGAN